MVASFTSRWYSPRFPASSAVWASSRSLAAWSSSSCALPAAGGIVVVVGAVVAGVVGAAARGVVVAVPGVVVVVVVPGEPVPVPPDALPKDTLHVVIVFFLPNIWSRPSWT